MDARLPLIGALAALLLLSSPSAHAADDGFSASLAEVKRLISAGEHKDALKELKALEKALGDRAAVVSQESLAAVWLYRGIAERALGGKKGRDIDAWRQALAVHNAADLDPELITDKEILGLFEALRDEVGSRGRLDAGVPEEVGAARLYADGVRLEPGDTVLPGLHLAQIECPDAQGTFSLVTDFSRPPDWLKLCPDGVDTSVVVEPEDEWAAFGPAFGGTPEDGSTTTTATTSTTTSSGTETPAAPEEVRPPREPRPPREGLGVLGTSLLTSGGVLLAGGAVVNFAVVAPTYARIEDARAAPNSITRSEADNLTARFNISRAATLGMLGGGVILVGTGFFVDAPVQPHVGPGTLGVSGRF